MPIDLDSALHRKIRNDEAFAVSKLCESLSSGSKENVHFKNPSDSGKVLWVVDIASSGDASYIGRLHDGFSSAPSGGSSMEIQAMLLDTEHVNNNGVAEANEGVSFTADSTHGFTATGGGSGSNTVGGVAHHTSVAMEPGREIVVEIENTSSGAANYTITIVYYEAAN